MTTVACGMIFVPSKRRTLVMAVCWAERPMAKKTKSVAKRARFIMTVSIGSWLLNEHCETSAERDDKCHGGERE
jgi:hypothetical protein